MEELLKKIDELYGLKVHSFEKVTLGFLSENHIISGENKKYFLKRYRFDTKERIEEVHSVKKYFMEGGIFIIPPLVTKEGTTFFFFDNSYYALFPFVADKQFERGSLTDTAIESLGETLGKIHLLGKTSTLPIKERFKQWNKEKVLEKIEMIRSEIKKKLNPSEFDVLALESIQTKKQLIQTNSITYEDIGLPSDHLIHGDYLDQNVFFGTNDTVSYVFDFEKTDYSPRMYELYRCLAYSFIHGTATKEDIRKIRLYLHSYLKIYPTSKDELSRGLKLFYLKSIHGVWVESEHYLQNNARADGFLLNNFKGITYFSENFKKFEDEILGK